MINISKANTSAAQFVDGRLEAVASAVDRFAGMVTATAGSREGTTAQNFGEPITRRLNKTAAQLRAQNGDAIVNGVKTQMLQNPGATVGIAAVIGAIAAQAALMMLKSEQKSQTLTVLDIASTDKGAKKQRKAKKTAANDDNGDVRGSDSIGKFGKHDAI